MKLLNILSILALFALPACGESADASGIVDGVKKAADGMDIGKTMTSLKSTLAGITDGKTAEGAKDKLSGLVDNLKGSVDKLGGLDKLKEKLGGMSGGVMTTIKDQIGKLMGNADITKHIGPILTKLKGMVGA